MKIKPKIIISSYDDIQNPYYSGGGARAIHSVAKRILKNYRVVVITSKFPNSKDEIIDGVRYKRIGISFSGAKIGQLIFQFFLIKKVLTEEFDIWLENFTPPFSTSFLPLFTKKPVIGLVHMLSAEDMTRKYKLPFHILENLGLKFYKYFIVVSKQTLEKIKKKNSSAETFLIPNGVNLVNLKSLLKAKKKHILFIGRIEVNQKGLDLLLKAYKLISKKIDVKLVIAGTGTKKEVIKLKKIITQLSLTRKVKLVGKVEGKTWHKVFKEAYVVVIPSRFETFSLVALEALAHQVPIVSFDIEGLKWLPKTVSLKVKKFDFKKLSEAIFRLATNSLERKRLLRKAPNILKEHTWDNVSSKYEKVFNYILSKK